LWTVLLWAASSLFAATAFADLNSIGVTLLRTVTTNLNGSGIPIAQPEASLTTNLPPTFEADPAATGNPAGLISYLSTAGMSSAFPNAIGGASWHAGVPLR